MRFSKTTGGFYPSGVQYDSLPDDLVEITDDDYQALLEGQAAGKRIVADESGRPVLQDPPPPTVEQVIAQYTFMVQGRLDAFAHTRGYDGILSACTYVTSTVPKFAAEGQYCVQARDATWAKCYEVLHEVQSGQQPMPTWADLEAELPPLEWPT
jgi:hypothetical protein